MSFTIRDLFYIAIIAIIIFIYGKVIDVKEMKHQEFVSEMKLEQEKKALELNKNIYNITVRSDSLDVLLKNLSLKRDVLNQENKKLKIQIRNIQNEYEKKLLFIDTASLNQVIQYWTDELAKRQHED